MNSPAISSLHIIGSKGPGGAENFYTRLILALHEAGSPVQAVNPPASPVATTLGNRITQTHISMRSVYDLVSRWQISSLVKQEQPDIVQTYMGRATRLTHLRPGTDPIHIARLGGYYNLKGYRHAHAWIGNTRGITDYLVRNGLPHQKVFYIGNFVDPVLERDEQSMQAIRQEHKIPPYALMICSVGRLHPNKAFDTLLNAFSRLPAEISDRPVHLLIAGDGDLKAALHSQAQTLDIETRVHWAGWQVDVGPYYHMADVFVCPSRHEPLGNVILEAWAHHCPVISTNTAGGTELIRDGNNGLLTDIDDPKSIAGKLLDLLQATPQDRLVLADNGLKTVQQNFSKKAIVNQYLSVYQQLKQSKAT